MSAIEFYQMVSDKLDVLVLLGTVLVTIAVLDFVRRFIFPSRRYD